MGYWLLMLLGCGALQAQDGQTTVQDLVPDQTAGAQDTYVPLTLGQNYVWSVHQIFSSRRASFF
jgi:hypothetical protein